MQSVELQDLCTGKNVHLSKAAKIELWSIHCGNCKDKIEDTVDPKSILINIDESQDQRANACDWIKSKHRKSLVDFQNSIKNQMGGGYPVPTELVLKDDHIKQVQIGYWRELGKSEKSK